MQLWYKSLGHLEYGGHESTQNLVHITKDKSYIPENKLLCEPLLLGKKRRQPFNKKGHIATKPLESVHIDDVVLYLQKLRVGTVISLNWQIITLI